MKDTLQGLQGGGGSNLVNGNHVGDKQKFDTKTGAKLQKPFATNEDGTPSTKNFMHNENGLFGVGEGKPPTGGAISHGQINQDTLHSQLSADGHLDTHAQAENGITKLPQNYGHPSDADMKSKAAAPPPKATGLKGFKAAFLAGFNKTSSKKPSDVEKGYPLDSETALAAFLKEYSIHSHLQNKHTIQELLDELEEPDEESDEESVEKSTLDGIMR